MALTMLLNSLRWEGRSSILKNKKRKKTPTLCTTVLGYRTFLISLMVKHLDGRELSLTHSNLATL